MRNRLLRAIEQSLVLHATPLANLALLMFKQIDDAQLRQVADSADYRPLKSFPWQIGDDDWMDWIVTGLDPLSAHPNPLPEVRHFLSALDLRPPVTKSSMNFMKFAKVNVATWASLRADGGGVPFGDGTIAGNPHTSN